MAVDLSPCSAEALRIALGLAAALGAAVDVVYVLEPSSGTLGRSGPGVESEVDALDRLRAFVSAAGGSSAAPMTERVEHGNVCQQIVALAAGADVDLVVMGTYGRTGRARSMIGSIAETVVRTSPRPVLTVQEPAARDTSAGRA